MLEESPFSRNGDFWLIGNFDVCNFNSVAKYTIQSANHSKGVDIVY